MDLFERRKQLFDRIGQCKRRCRIGQRDAHPHDKQQNTQRHKQRKNDALEIDVNEAPLKKQRVASGPKNIEERGQRNDQSQRAHRSQHDLHGNAADQHQEHRKQGDKCKSRRALDKEQHNNIEERKKQFCARIGTVQHRIAAEILSERDILHHARSPPSSGSSAAFAASTV